MASIIKVDNILDSNGNALNVAALAIEEQRVKLRDVTKHEALMSAMTVEQLKACTLEELLK